MIPSALGLCCEWVEGTKRVLMVVAVPTLFLAPIAAESQTTEARDSAGISVVATGPEATVSDWAIEKEPSLRIGQIEGGKPYLFTLIWDALRAPDGSIVVVEGSTYEIRVFGPEGRHLTTFGGRGDGPNEFGGPPWIAFARPDTLVVWDPGHYRLSRYDLAGHLLSQRTYLSTVDSLAIGMFPNGLVWQVASDGALLWTGPSPSLPGAIGLVHRMSRVVLIPDGHQDVHDFGLYLGGQAYYMRRKSDGGSSGMSNPFAPLNIVALGPPRDRLAVSDAALWTIRIFDGTGRLRKIWRGQFPRVPVTSSMVAAARRGQTRMAGALRLSLRQAEKAFDALPMPDSVPAIGTMMWDRTGNLWVGERRGELRDIRDYQVLDQHGRWRSTVILPRGVGRVFDIGEDYLLAEVRDKYGVQYLDEYQIYKH